MNAQQFTSLADQVARQQPELAAYDADIAKRQPTVDALRADVTAAQAALDAAHAAVTAAQADIDVFTERREAARAIEDEQVRAEALAAIDAALVAPLATLHAARQAVQVPEEALRAAQDALGGPAAELDGLTVRADAIRASIAQCQAAMSASGLSLDAAALQVQRLADARVLAWERIKAKRDRLSRDGGYLVSGKWYHSDEKSKTQQLSLFVMGAAVPAVQWKTMDGSFVTMTQALSGGIFQAAAAQDMAIFAAAEQHRAAMTAATDPLAYDFSGGWPAVFPGISA